jgi:predicted HTH transcriptional regulator
MLTPKEVFDNPLQYVDFLQSADFEGQYFERKEVRIDTNNQINALKDKIKQCISAFANSNRGGGLLALGIADDGTIIGTQHVDEQTINSILQVARDLSNHATQLKEVVLPNSDGKRLHLLYTPWTPNGICETFADFPKAWKRFGAQCFLLRRIDDEQLRRDKGIVDFEMSYCAPYNEAELDKDVIEEFKSAFLETRGAQYEYSTEAFLLNIDAIRQTEGDKCAFTNAGYLFFASYPRKHFPSAYVRILRFEVDVEESQNRGGTTFDRDFDGALPKLIRKLKTFFEESAIFRTFIERGDSGRFIEDPEYPLLAVDEAVVNAVMHRDYGFSEAIHCIAYQNGFVVKSPGSIPQDVPQQFSLEDTVLSSVLRNPKLVEWMRFMKDERGKPLVRALSEGTRRMCKEMEKLGLPAPYYETGRDTFVTLYNRDNHLADRSTPQAAYKTTSEVERPSEKNGLKKTLRSIGERLTKIQ